MRAVDSVPVPERLRLFDKMKPIGVFSRSRHVSSLISWKHHHTNFIYPRAQDFFNDDRQGCLRGSIPVDKSLQGKRPLIFAGGGDNCAFDFHECCVLCARKPHKSLLTRQGTGSRVVAHTGELRESLTGARVFSTLSTRAQPGMRPTATQGIIGVRKNSDLGI